MRPPEFWAPVTSLIGSIQADGSDENSGRAAGRACVAKSLPRIFGTAPCANPPCRRAIPIALPAGSGNSPGWQASRTPVSLCGRNAVQIHERRPVDLTTLARQLARLGSVRANEFALRFYDGEYEMTVFPDGRAIIKGTTDIGLARSVYSRYLGIKTRVGQSARAPPQSSRITPDIPGFSYTESQVKTVAPPDLPAIAAAAEERGRVSGIPHQDFRQMLLFEFNGRQVDQHEQSG